MKKMIVILLSLILLAACSQQPLSNKENRDNEAKSELTPTTKAATTIEGILKQGSGKYGGNKYDKRKVQAALDKVPANMPPEKIYNYLVALLAEDYNPIISQLNYFDTGFSAPVGPNGSIETPGVLNKKVNIEILLDSSGSMAEQIDGRTKMDLAKEAINQFVASMPQGANVSLRVYGHKGSNQKKDKAVSCNSSEVVYPLGAYDNQKFENSLNRFQPTGWTPLALAIRSAKQDLGSQQNAENIIYIVSDGVETCGGNPVQEAQQLHNSNVKAVVNIIGFDVDNAGQQALKQVAQSGGGTYYTVNNQEDLKEYFNKQYDELSKKWGEWLSKDIDDVGQQASKKLQTIDQLLNEGVNKLNIEYEHFMDAREYLVNKQKVADVLSLDQFIKDRANLINDYIVKKHDQLGKEIGENSSNRYDDAGKKFEDAQNQINQQRKQ